MTRITLKTSDEVIELSQLTRVRIVMPASELPPVMCRNGCCGAQAAAGNMFVERILTPTAVCCQRGSTQLTIITKVLQAHRLRFRRRPLASSLEHA